jgi:ABC-type sugar transport system substrate-binding protein
MTPVSPLKHKEKQNMKSSRIVSITKNASNPAYIGARCGMDRFARQHGVEVMHMTPVVDDSIAEQQAFLRALLDDLPAALLISAAHHSDLDAELEALRDAGVVIVMFVGRTTRKDLATCFVGSDDRAMTSAVAEAVCRELGGKGTLMMVNGNPLGILYEARASGFRDGAAKFPGVRVLGEKDGDFLRGPAGEAMKALIEAHGVPDAVLAANDFSSMGVLDTLKATGARLLIGSVNATPDGVAAIRRGDMFTSAAFNAMAMGCIALEAALRVLRGETIPSEILLAAELVTLVNVDEWNLPYEKRPLPDWDEVLRSSEGVEAQYNRADRTSIA